MSTLCCMLVCTSGMDRLRGVGRDRLLAAILLGVTDGKANSAPATTPRSAEAGFAAGDINAVLTYVDNFEKELAAAHATVPEYRESLKMFTSFFASAGGIDYLRTVNGTTTKQPHQPQKSSEDELPAAMYGLPLQPAALVRHNLTAVHLLGHDDKVKQEQERHARALENYVEQDATNILCVHCNRPRKGRLNTNKFDVEDMEIGQQYDAMYTDFCLCEEEAAASPVSVPAAAGPAKVSLMMSGGADATAAAHRKRPREPSDETDGNASPS